MTADQALALLTGLLEVALIVAGPLVAASFFGGLVVGVLQTATQINEASIGYAVKTFALVAALLVVGPLIADKAVGYTRDSLRAVGEVVR